MKNLFVFYALMAVFFFTACQQDELITEVTEVEAIIHTTTRDTFAIRQQLHNAPILTETIVKDSLVNLKSGNIEGVVTYQVFTLNTLENYPVYNDHAEKVWWYNGVNEEGQLVVSITVYQRFEINEDGSIDLNSWKFRWMPYCQWPYYKNLYLESYEYLKQLTYNFYDEDGKLKLSYFGKRYQDNINLVKIPNGHWEINAFYDDGSVPMFFTGSPDLNSESNLLELEYQFMSSEIISILQVEKDLLKDAVRINFYGINPENEERINLLRPIVYNENMADLISFELPIDVTEVYICGADWCRWYEIYATLVNNQLVYRLRQ